MKAFVLTITFVILSNLSFAEEVISIQARQNVTVPVLFVKSNAPSTVAIIMLVGNFEGREGSFFSVSPDDGSIKKESNSFLLRTIDQFADRGFSVAVMNPPSDKNNRMSDDYRTSKEHVEDVSKIIGVLNDKGFDAIYLISTSRGTLSASYLGANLKHKSVKGVILTSTNVNLVKWTPISDIEYPTLFVQHKDDGCKACQYRDAVALSKRLKRSPRVDFISVEGGNEPKSGPCGGLSAHGYFGIETRVVDAISNWISDRQKESIKQK